MADRLEREDEFLLKEYDTAVQLTFHVDEMRSKFTNLFITLVGVAAAAVSLLLQGSANNNQLGNYEVLLGVFLLLLGLTGILVVSVIAKLRRVQLEHYRITNNMRKHFLGSNYSLWNVVQLSDRTLPSPTRTSGTYFWTLILILINSYVVGLGIYLLLRRLDFTVMGTFLFIIIQDMLYFRLAVPPKVREYSKDSLPSS
jgi:hypothetical protein